MLFLYIVTALITLWLWNLRAATSVLVGGTLAVINLDLLKRIILVILSGPVQASGIFGAFYWVKFAALCAVIFFVIINGMVSPVPMVIGFSSLLVAITIYALYYQIQLIRQEQSEEDDELDEGPVSPDHFADYKE
ncbi:MAG: ATP synthase subunit I [Candidatus Alcyoniella australis]|nr:ATP synthase subunit I [Candidatus Alcyoniella australis]